MLRKARRRAKKEGVKVKVLVLCNLHNPLGRCYPQETLLGLMEFCNQYKMRLIMNEIYAMSVYSTTSTDTQFTSVLSLDWTQHIDPNYLHPVHGLSKDFAVGCLRIGSLHTFNAPLQYAISAIPTFHHSSTTSAILAYTSLENTEFYKSFFASSRKRLAGANSFAKALLDEHRIQYAAGANTGYFLWIDLRPWLRDEDDEGEWEREAAQSSRMAAEEVFMMGGRAQGAEEAGWARFIFSRKEIIVREGVRRLRALKGE